jgi:LemA protein
MSDRIPDEYADDIFTLATQLYQQQQQQSGYSAEQLQQAGSEVNIPPEFIQAAIEQFKQQQKQQAIAQQQAKQNRQKIQNIAIGVGAVMLLWAGFTYNSLSGAQQNADLAWAQVENQIQRKADLIPNLVSVVQASAQQDPSLINQLNASRQQYLEAQTPEEQIAAVADLNQALGQAQTALINNPQLQQSPLYIGLQDEIAGSENRIATERMRYNEAVALYNQRISAFPSSIIAGLFGFEKRNLFERN